MWIQVAGTLKKKNQVLICFMPACLFFVESDIYRIASIMKWLVIICVNENMIVINIHACRKKWNVYWTHYLWKELWKYLNNDCIHKCLLEIKYVSYFSINWYLENWISFDITEISFQWNDLGWYSVRIFRQIYSYLTSRYSVRTRSRRILG